MLNKVDFIAHSVAFGDIISKNDKVHIFRPSVTFCCYGNKKPLATNLLCYNTSTKCLNVLEIMMMVNYSYATHYIESNCVCFTYQRCCGQQFCIAMAYPADILTWNHYQTLVII